MDEARHLFGERAGLAERFAEILRTRGIERGLLGPREADRVWLRHVVNSLAVSGLIPEGSSVLDVGSGAGLPGIPLAIARPDVHVTLLEPLLRRYTFLVETVGDLGLSAQVDVVRGRAEEHRGSYPVVTCRAVASLDRLVEWCMPLVAPGGSLLALKGSSAGDEVRSHESVLRAGGLVADVVPVAVPGGSEQTYVIRVRRTTDGRPRQAINR